VVLSTLVDLGVFLADGSAHDVKLLTGVATLDTTNSLPDFVRFELLVLVHEESGTLGEEEHAVEYS